MATDKIRLVQGDTAPQLQLSMTDQRTRRPLDLSAPGTTARLLFREVGADTVKATMPCFAIAGYVDPETGDVDYRPPYDVAGRGGRLAMDWSADALDTAGEFEGEVEVTFPDGRIQTAFAILKFQVREQF
ncbi:hypothetical protein U2261_18980 [Achromobacter xylosoxidans]|uniref:hypothetical protein n=1 Tax=Alcaligenes xylosoxydans xylosoxydans TaxID=85698 RepID=UPI002ACAB7F0|nr:hypothetical protein [Achromobacter xylosoxidans]MDZ5616707.1 hypothetical protein [Achromobacter xylosoxidans]MDZ5626109.1 hypothetical protein [Achromobacter xylosoxidans]MDZ5686867.1 hypothetical protein [Achromobacter xylosoxidans]